MEQEAKIIGVEIFWDHKLKKFRKKRLDLERCPMKYRCPHCGEILVNRFNRSEGHREHGIDENGKHIWIWVPEETSPYRDLELMFSGGVCRKCMRDGFGRMGWLGLIVKKEDEEREKKQKEFEEEAKRKGLTIDELVHLKLHPPKLILPNKNTRSEK